MEILSRMAAGIEMADDFFRCAFGEFYRQLGRRKEEVAKGQWGKVTKGK